MEEEGEGLGLRRRRMVLQCLESDAEVGGGLSGMTESETGSEMNAAGNQCWIMQVQPIVYAKMCSVYNVHKDLQHLHRQISLCDCCSVAAHVDDSKQGTHTQKK